jgi:hypothetical protein
MAICILHIPPLVEQQLNEKRILSFHYVDQYYFMDFMFLEHDLEQYFLCDNLSNTVLYNNSTLCSFCNPGNFFPHNYYTQIDFSASNPTNKSATKQVLHIVIHANVTREIDCFTEQIYSRVYLCPLWKNKFPTWSEKLTWSLLQGKIPLGFNDDRFWQKKSHFGSCIINKRHFFSWMEFHPWLPTSEILLSSWHAPRMLLVYSFFDTLHVWTRILTFVTILLVTFP